MASKKDIPSSKENVTVVSDGQKWEETVLANPTLMQRAEKRTGKKGTIALHPLWNDEHPDHMKIKKAHEEYQKKIKEDAKKRSGLKGSAAWGPPRFFRRGGKRRRKTRRKKKKRKTRKAKHRRKKKTRRRKRRGMNITDNPLYDL